MGNGTTVQAGKRATYPAYRPSGMDWVGDVPEHWDVRRLKYTASINDEALPETTDPDYEFTYVDIGSVDASKGVVATETYRFEDAPSRARRIVREGDTIVSTVRTYLRAIAAIREPAENLIVSTGFAVVRPRSLDPGYLSYALRSPFFVETVVSRSTGVSYPAINAPEVGNIGVTLPPLDEQKAIAAFLDRETARIDALIEKKRRQIELLQEKRSALISHAVTKGLDPNAPMKDSGIEWLGQIPKHWEVKQLKRAVMFQRGHDLPQQDRLAGEVPLVTSAGVSAWHNEPAAKGPGIVTGRYGTIGHFHLVEQDYWPLNTTLYSTTVHGNNTRFVWYMLHLLTPVFMVEAGKSAVPGVDRNDLHPIPVCVPPVTEQADIVRKLDRETAQIDQLAARVEDSIKMLQEHRTALIAASVTGKIDVRKEVSGE